MINYYKLEYEENEKKILKKLFSYGELLAELNRIYFDKSVSNLNIEINTVIQ